LTPAATEGRGFSSPYPSAPTIRSNLGLGLVLAVMCGQLCPTRLWLGIFFPRFTSFWMCGSLRLMPAATLLGAVNLPFPKLSESLESLPRGLPILVYGEEAEEATKILRNQGLLARVLGADPERWASLFRSLSVGETPPPPKIFGDVPAFPAENLAKRYLLVLDLRPAEIFREGTLPGAIQVNPEDLPAWAERLPKAGDLPEGVSFQVWGSGRGRKGGGRGGTFPSGRGHSSSSPRGRACELAGPLRPDLVDSAVLDQDLGSSVELS
jgi:rhodanese-related sulfurtransferase